ncbi:T-complex protein 11-like protein 1 isoform X1 [Anopheles bellator]|uniref:T-complex protein 11-like protein 1 isoform X1 n=1 Tax=Anopheles bellator TaxID=139047 RepID=UPI0026482AC4|nr:T-complex protein 11-like protein 1 isoform X1 [Anopheles bellator]
MPDTTRSGSNKPEHIEEEGTQEEISECLSSLLQGNASLNDQDESGIIFSVPGVSGQPAKVVNLLDLKNLAKSCEDMALAHEIAVNEEFKLMQNEDSGNSITRTVRDTMHRAYWDVVQVQLNAEPPCYDMAMDVLSNIKQAFGVLLTGNNDRALEKINSYLDEQLIRRHAEEGVLNLAHVAHFVIDMMARACCMDRDAEVEQLKSITDTVQLLRGILEVLGHMKVDMANFVLTMTRKEFAARSIEYEKKKFAEIQHVCNDNFPLTIEWLKRHKPEPQTTGAVSSTEVTSSNIAEAAHFSTKPRTSIPEHIIAAYVELLHPTSNTDDFPELLNLDRRRFEQLKAEVMRVIICDSILCYAGTCVAKSDQLPLFRKNLAHKLMILIKDCVDDQQFIEVAENLWLQVKDSMHTYHSQNELLMPDPTSMTLLKTHIENTCHKKSHVFAVMHNRSIELFKVTLQNDIESAPFFSSFRDYQTELAAILKTVKRITNHNYAVYGDYYAKLIRDNMN